jgi:uncharacterized protein
VSHDASQIAGPHLYEQTDYPIFLRSAVAGVVKLAHRDPVLIRDIRPSGCNDAIHGIINFGSQVGYSEFSITVDGERELDFEVEVFPTKLDYASDYEQLLAEVQDVLTGLILEYLRSTFQLGSEVHVPQPTHVEWLTLLRHVIDDLEKAVLHIARQPIRAVTRNPEQVRSDQIRQLTSTIRRQVLRGSGVGQLVAVSRQFPIREKLHDFVVHPTSDTPEHRWLKHHLDQIRRRLASLQEAEREQKSTPRRLATLDELSLLETKISVLLRTEPLRTATGHAPPGFASLQLISAAGYREAYKCCLILNLGLRFTGGPIRLALKDLSVLYEYWCYLQILKIAADITSQKVPVRDLLAVEQDGLRILLQKGREKNVPFDMPDGRRLAVTYNPRFQNEPILIPQQPDFVLSIFDREWPVVRLVVDAKYRVENDLEYVKRYGSPGPPDDAINVLHRYRDAILDLDLSHSDVPATKRTVIQCVALFPHREEAAGDFRGSRLWRAVSRLGIGAIPALPGDVGYLREWLHETVKAGGWALADKVIPHRSHERAADWRIAASERVLVGVLRAGNEQEHLDWITAKRLYYVPASKQPQQYATKYVALYIPAALRHRGAVLFWASVNSIDVVKRTDIATPWPSRRGNALQVVYQLSEFQRLPRAIENRGRSGPRESRWTSRLGLLRGSNLQELMLETEPEWRLYEDLREGGVLFSLEAGNPRMPDPEDPRGRAWFVIGDIRIQYRGGAGFLLRKARSEDQYVPTLDISTFRSPI